MLQGEYCLYEIDEQGVWLPRFAAFRRNAFLYTWGHLAAQSLGRGDRNYRISTMYLEFQNGATPGSVAPPAFDPDDGVEYYDALASSPNRDYLRVPIEATPNIVVAPGYEALLPPDQGNRVIFAVQTGGTQGVHGKPFSEGVGSVVFGIALVATPVLNDATADILLSRHYYDPADQVPKAARQLSAVYRVTFGEETP
jgi:hypothetical protein